MWRNLRGVHHCGLEVMGGGFAYDDPKVGSSIPSLFSLAGDSARDGKKGESHSHRSRQDLVRKAEW